MSRDPVRLAMGGPAGARLARAMRVSRKADAPYDVASGLARFTATVGAAGTVGIVASAGPAEASGAVAKTAAANAVAGAGKAALGIKATMSSILLIGAVGSGTLVATSQVLRNTDPSTMTRAAAPAGEAPASIPPRALEAPSPVAVPIEERTIPPEIPPKIAPHAVVPTSPSAEAGDSSRGAASSSHDIAADRAGGRGAPGAGASARSAASIKPEMEHLALLRRTYDPVRALALADEGHARFPRGLFWQERESVAIGSLARLGRTSEAQARARRFIVRHPESLYVEELRRMLGE